MLRAEKSQEIERENYPIWRLTAKRANQDTGNNIEAVRQYDLNTLNPQVYPSIEWRPDLLDYRNLASANLITLKSLGRRYLELPDEIALLDVMIAAPVHEPAPDLVFHNSIG